jgi:hypothetical protein
MFRYTGVPERQRGRHDELHRLADSVAKESRIFPFWILEGPTSTPFYYFLKGGSSWTKYSSMNAQFEIFGSPVVGSAVPEPSTWAMMLVGFAGLGFAGFRASRNGATFAA